MEEGGASAISSVHSDIVESHILSQLDGPTLASLSCTSSTLHSLSSHTHLWSQLCYSTWPSTATSHRLRHLISTFPHGGPRSFFSLSFPLPPSSSSITNHPFSTSELISAVDIHYHNNLIFSKVQETETLSGWFKCSPFRIDLVDPKDVILTGIPHPDGQDICGDILTGMTLSWILIDPTRPRAMNLSSFKPVSAQRHWLTGEVQVRFATVLSGGGGGMVQCEIVVVCGGSEGGEMQVREVSVEMEDMEGIHLNGRDSLVILERAMEEGKRGKGMRREEEGRRRYREYVEKKRERRDRKMRIERVLDMLSLAFGVTAFSALCFFIFCT